MAVGVVSRLGRVMQAGIIGSSGVVPSVWGTVDIARTSSFANAELLAWPYHESAVIARLL